MVCTPTHSAGKLACDRDEHELPSQPSLHGNYRLECMITIIAIPCYLCILDMDLCIFLGRFADAWANGGVPDRSEAMRVELASIQQRVEREHRAWARKETMLKNNLGKAEAEVSTLSSLSLV